MRKGHGTGKASVARPRKLAATRSKRRTRTARSDEDEDEDEGEGEDENENGVHDVDPDSATPACTDKNATLDRQFYNMIHGDTQLYLRVLRYEPIAFDELASRAVQLGIKRKGWKSLLKEFLDKRVSWPCSEFAGASCWSATEAALTTSRA